MSTAQQQQLYSLQEQYITEVTEPEERVVIHVNGELGPHGGLAVEESGGVESSSTVTLMSLKLLANLFFFGGG